MENNEIIEIVVKVKFIGEFSDFTSWIKNTQDCANRYGITSKMLHIDCNGFTTTGYDLRNTLRENVYPVKTYLQIQDDQVSKPMPFQASSNN